MARRLAACLLNVSEGRNQRTVREIAEAAISNQQNWIPDKTLLSHNASEGLTKDCANSAPFKCSATVLNIFRDVEYNRSVITLAAPVEFLGTCVFQACEKAYKAIDLTKHKGGHPRLGAVDLIPIHPLSKSVSLEECGSIARTLGQRIVQRIPNASVFFFGHADLPEKRGLVKRRKEMNWYSGKHDPSRNYQGSQCGTTGIGAIPYMTNFNISIDTIDLEIGNLIAKSIRGSSPGGLFGVQSMAFSHKDQIEIACNVDTPDLQKVDFYAGPVYSSFEDIRSRVQQLCKEFGVTVSGSVVIGFTPEEAHGRALQYLLEGKSFEIREFDSKRM